MQNKNLIIIGVVVVVIVATVIAYTNNQGVNLPQENGENNSTSTVDEAMNNASGSMSGEESMEKKMVTYTLATIASHNSGTDCWSVVNGNVYDLTQWISKHPGGEEAILKLCGKDGSELFNNQHGGQEKQQETLAGFHIGVLSQ
ncbi:MAG: cytochrome b5 domain-containing protein [Anaplasmataceae bacterium]|nr:cytochrome b5 domain-containing protein [Anaplasmataceae bacterium]